MILNKKIAVFIGDYFWSSIPYDGLNLYHELSSEFDVDLLMFEKDIRLNKRFSGNERFFFDRLHFTESENLKTINNWSELYQVSKDYDLLLSSTHIAPKTRSASDFHRLQCKWGAWDIGGVDLLVNAKAGPPLRPVTPDYFFTKGQDWKQWVDQIKKKTKNEDEFAFATGCPHYDYYLEDAPLKFGKALDEKEFISKYNLDKDKEFILVMPSNPGSPTHNEQFAQNMEALSFLNDEASKNKTEILLKTYPHDYIFYEKGNSDTEASRFRYDFCKKHWRSGCTCLYTGLYHRRHNSKMAQYEWISNQFPNFKTIDSQDHFAAVTHCKKIFNVAGSSVSWETYFTKSKAFSMNYSNKGYFGTLSYLPKNIIFPDKSMNHEITNIEEAFSDLVVDKESCDGFILKEYSLKNIKNTLRS